jgi:hypothetical protein
MLALLTTGNLESLDVRWHQWQYAEQVFNNAYVVPIYQQI